MEKQRRAYITILTTESYLQGVLVLYFSLRRYSKEDFVVLIDEHISEKVEQQLKQKNMKVIRMASMELAEDVLTTEMRNDRWYHTLFKLKVFGLTEYDRLVYLDSDLLICGNIDSLFEMAEMSAVPDAVFYPRYSRGGMNAGVISIIPSKATEHMLLARVPEVAEKMKVFGDQDVINEYYASWDKESEKHLDVRYNACFYEMDNYGEIEPLIVHFILGNKPWMWSRLHIYGKKLKWFLLGGKKKIKYLNEYLKILRKVR